MHIHQPDTQTLREAGIHGTIYKVILGSKSYSPSVRPENAIPGPSFRDREHCCFHETLKYEFDKAYSEEDADKLGAYIWDVRM